MRDFCLHVCVGKKTQTKELLVKHYVHRFYDCIVHVISFGEDCGGGRRCVGRAPTQFLQRGGRPSRFPTHSVMKQQEAASFSVGGKRTEPARIRESN